MGAKSYNIYDSPKPLNWYKRRIGWFGQYLALTFVISLLTVGGLTYTFTQNSIQASASTATNIATANQVAHKPLPQQAAKNIVDLQPILDAWAKDNDQQKWGIVVKSLEGPSFNASLNADKEFESASIYKLFLTLPLFDQIAVEHQKGVNLTVNGKNKSIATCVDLMLRVSNNECGEAIGEYLGWQKVTRSLAQKGYSHTDFSKQANLVTSAGDTASFMESLYGDMFDRQAREIVMESLKQQRWRQGIPSGCPGCQVANKTGFLNNVMHDAAILQYQGGTYVLTVFSEGGTFKQIAELTGQIQQKIIDTTK